MMLRFSLNQEEAAQRIEAAVQRCWPGPAHADIYSEGTTKVGTAQMGDAVVKALRLIPGLGAASGHPSQGRLWPPFLLQATVAQSTLPHALAHARNRLESAHAMFAARPFALNTATAALAGVAVRAITTKTTTIIGADPAPVPSCALPGQTSRGKKTVWSGTVLI